MSSTRITQFEEIEYPTGDRKPMAETPVHRRNLTDTIEVLERRLADVEQVYISGNMLLYYEEGNRRRHVSPDVFVVFGVPRRERDCYKTWEEPKPTLDLVVEFTSPSTRDEDLIEKFELYRDRLDVKEYLLFDLYSEYLDPPQQLFRLVDGEYVQVEPLDGRLPSQLLGVHFERDGQWLRLYDPQTGRRVPTTREVAAAAIARHERAERERGEAAARLRAQESELERLRQELERLRSGGHSNADSPEGGAG